MTPETFAQLVDQWAADVKAEALHLFESGVPPEKVLHIAIQVYDAKTIARLQREKGPVPRLLLPHRN